MLFRSTSRLRRDVICLHHTADQGGTGEQCTGMEGVSCPGQRRPVATRGYGYSSCAFSTVTWAPFYKVPKALVPKEDSDDSGRPSSSSTLVSHSHWQPPRAPEAPLYFELSKQCNTPKQDVGFFYLSKRALNLGKHRVFFSEVSSRSELSEHRRRGTLRVV